MSYIKYLATNKKIFLQILLFPIAILSKIIPKDENLYLYGSMYGFDIVDNSKYHYLLNKNKKKFFIVKNKSILNNDKYKKYNPIYYLSLKGLLYSLIAKNVFYTHSIYDFNPALIFGSKITNLWHGVPVYNTLYNKKLKFNIKNKIRLLVYKVLPYSNPFYFDYIYLSQEHKILDYEYIFSINRKKILIREQSKNIFFNRNKPKKKLIKILYCPTHRLASLNNFDPNNFINILKYIEDFLIKRFAKKRFIVHFKPHPLDYDLFFKNVKTKFDLDCNDLNDYLHKYDIVITDFSSIFYDCLERKIDVLIYADDYSFFEKKLSLSQSKTLYDKSLIKDKKELINNIIRLVNKNY